MRQIPNSLSCLRILLAILFPFMSAGDQALLIGLALLTEFLDGFLARRFGWDSVIGQILDPIADKTFFISVSVTWILAGRLTWRELALLGTREIGIAAAVLTLLLIGRFESIAKMKAQPLGKVTTALQYAAFFCLLYRPQWLTVLVASTAIFGILALVQYLLKFKQSAEG